MESNHQPVSGEGQVPSKLARIALNYAIISIFFFGFILGPIAIVKSRQARKAILTDPQREGEGKAAAAGIIGGVSTVLWILGGISALVTYLI